MVIVKTGDMFESDAQTLVNTVNCVGVMGAGIALEFRKRFPDMYEEYVRRCQMHLVRLGEPYLYRRLLPPWVLNFPTKQDWRSVSRLDDIVRGLAYLSQHVREWGITSLAVPPLGCGQGQLEWRVVGPTLYRHLKALAIPVELYAPFGTPHDELQPEYLDRGIDLVPAVAPEDRVGPGWAVVVEILRRVEAERFHWPIGRTSFQKIAYFATKSGIPTGLKYERGSYGPFAADLKKRVSALVNNGMICEESTGRMLAIRTGPTFEDARRAYADSIEQWSSAIDRVSQLFMRMQTTQAEVAATVHFVAEQRKVQGHRLTEEDLLADVMLWKQRRRPPLSDADVAAAVRNLNALHWIDAKPSDDLPLAEDDLLRV